MPRRHSHHNQPTSPNLHPLDHDSVFIFHDGTKQSSDDTDGRKCSTSFTGFFNKLLPSHRPERGGTLRDHGFWEQEQSADAGLGQRPGLDHKHGSDSIVSSGWNPAIPLPPRTQTSTKPGFDRSKRPSRLQVQSHPLASRPRTVTPTRPLRGRRVQQDEQSVAVDSKTHTETEIKTSAAFQPPLPGWRNSVETSLPRITTTFDAKREARRLRRSLKESRDFLGVQGVNPHTGVMDVLTPTSSSPTDHTIMSAPEPEPKGYSGTMSGFRAAYQRAARTRDTEEASLERIRKEQERFDKMQRKKDSIRAFQQRVRWRKDTNQWSSVAEPDLSPIVDASTRSSTQRSASDGANIPPAPIQKDLRWEQQRAASTPAGLQTTISTPRSRPEITAQESSDTVIHTPNPSGQRRYSLIPGIIGNGIKGPSPKAARRTPESAPATIFESPGSSPSNRAIPRKPVPPPKDKITPPQLKISIPEDPAQYSVPGPSRHQTSFLGSRMEPARARNGHHSRAQTNMTLWTHKEIGHDENSYLNGIPNMDKTPVGSPPDVAVRDFAKERIPQLSSRNHPSILIGPASQSPSVSPGQGINVVTPTSSQSMQRIPRPNRAPMIPRRVGSSQKDTSLLPKTEARGKPTALIEIGDLPSLDCATKQAETGSTLASGWAKDLMEDILSFGQKADTPSGIKTTETKNESLKQQVMEDTADLGQHAKNHPLIETAEETYESPTKEVATKETAKSAYTPTTTITGYDPRLPLHARLVYRKHRMDGAIGDRECKDDPATRISTTENKGDLDGACEDNGPNDTRVTQISTTELMDAEVTAEEPETGPLPQKNKTLTSVQQQTQASFDLLASPPRLPPSIWPSIAIAAPHRRQYRSAPRSQHHQRRDQTGSATAPVTNGHPEGPANGTISMHHPPAMMNYHGEASQSAQATITMESGPAISTISTLPPSTMYEAKDPSEPVPTAISSGLPGPIMPTTSARQLMPTRERCEKLCRRVSPLPPRPRTTTDPLMTPASGPNNVFQTLRDAENTKPLVPTPVSARQPQKYRHMPSSAYDHLTAGSSTTTPSSSSLGSVSTTPTTAATPPESSNDNSQEENRRSAAAKEAARTAIAGTQYGAATARVVHVVSRKRKTGRTGRGTSTAADRAGSGDESGGNGAERENSGQGRGGGGDIAGPSSAMMEGARTDTKVRRVTLRDPPVPRSARDTTPVVVAAADFVARFLRAYWAVIAPVFDAASPVSKRFSAGRSTWRDVSVYAAAMVFVLGAFLLVVWGVQGMLLVYGVGRAVVGGCMVLVGI